MNLRRGLMAQMANIPGGYKVIRITNPTFFRLGSDLYNWLQSVLPQCQIAYGVLDWDFSDPVSDEDGTCYAFGWLNNGSSNIFWRSRNASNGNTYDFQSTRQMIATYLCVVKEGATFTVFYR